MKKQIIALILCAQLAFAGQPTKIQVGNVGGSAVSASTLSFTFPGNTTIGNAIFIVVGVLNNQTVNVCTRTGDTFTKPFSDAATAGAGGITTSLQANFSLAATNNNSITCTVSTAQWTTATAIEVSGLFTSSATAADVSASNTATTGATSMTCGTTALPTYDWEYVIVVGGISASTTVTAGSGFVLEKQGGDSNNGNNPTVFIEDKVGTSSQVFRAAQAGTATGTAAGGYSCITATFKAPFGITPHVVQIAHGDPLPGDRALHVYTDSLGKPEEFAA